MWQVPDDKANDNLTLQPDDYNYSCFNFAGLFAQALFQTPFDQLAKSDKKHTERHLSEGQDDSTWQRGSVHPRSSLTERITVCNGR